MSSLVISVVTSVSVGVAAIVVVINIIAIVAIVVAAAVVTVIAVIIVIAVVARSSDHVGAEGTVIICFGFGIVDVQNKCSLCQNLLSPTTFCIHLDKHQ